MNLRKLALILKPDWHYSCFFLVLLSRKLVSKSYRLQHRLWTGKLLIHEPRLDVILLFPIKNLFSFWLEITPGKISIWQNRINNILWKLFPVSKNFLWKNGSILFANMSRTMKQEKVSTKQNRTQEKCRFGLNNVRWELE